MIIIFTGKCHLHLGEKIFSLPRWAGLTGPCWGEGWCSVMFQPILQVEKFGSWAIKRQLYLYRWHKIKTPIYSTKIIFFKEKSCDKHGKNHTFLAWGTNLDPQGFPWYPPWNEQHFRTWKQAVYLPNRKPDRIPSIHFLGAKMLEGNPFPMSLWGFVGFRLTPRSEPKVVEELPNIYLWVFPCQLTLFKE